jgi:hypothetical protein
VLGGGGQGGQGCSVRDAAVIIVFDARTDRLLTWAEHGLDPISQ